MAVLLTIIRRPVKHARLRVREDASVQLVVPHGFDQSLIDRLLEKKAAWIARHQQYFRERKPNRSTLANDEILLFDRAFWFVHEPTLRHRVEVDEAAGEIRSGRILTYKPTLDRWYRDYAKTYLTYRAEELSTVRRLPFGRLFIRSQRTKWGSCSSKGNVSLNWRLILTPKHVINYVILHELVHTKILNHSHRFWAHLRAVFPEAEKSIRWIKQHTPDGCYTMV